MKKDAEVLGTTLTDVGLLVHDERLPVRDESLLSQEK
jgi:hypothetical protein